MSHEPSNQINGVELRPTRQDTECQTEVPGERETPQMQVSLCACRTGQSIQLIVHEYLSILILMFFIMVRDLYEI